MWFHVLSCSLWSIIRHIQHANIRTQSLLSTKSFDKICNVCEGSVLCVPSSYILQSLVQLMHYSAFHYWMSKDRSKKKKTYKISKIHNNSWENLWTEYWTMRILVIANLDLFVFFQQIFFSYGKRGESELLFIFWLSFQYYLNRNWKI